MKSLVLQLVLIWMVMANAVIIVDPHWGCQSQAIKSPGEETHAIWLLSACFCCQFSLPISSCHCLPLSLYRSLSVVYFWRVISSFRVSTTGSQAHPFKRMSDQSVSHRPWVFLQLAPPEATRETNALTVCLAKSQSVLLFLKEKCLVVCLGFICARAKTFQFDIMKTGKENKKNSGGFVIWNVTVRLISCDFHHQRQKQFWSKW